jgi:tetratricopeptide (TPR) repeat protein
MRDAVKRSRRTVLVMTPNWVASDWATYEGALARTRDPAGRKERTIPLLREKCEVPESIAFLTHIDFTRRNRLAWRQLLTALGVPPQPAQAEHATREEWLLAHPYPMPPHFTGRAKERAMLTAWLSTDTEHPVLVLRALGGFGKSALTWHWLLHDVSPTKWRRVVWWSFYESDASFESFVARTVRYLSEGAIAADVPPRSQIDALLRSLQSRGALLVLDGFERTLRAFGGLDAAYRGDATPTVEGAGRDSLSRLAEVFLRSVASLPKMQGKVLLTTRLRPSALEALGDTQLQGCREEELVQLQPADAVELFRAQGIRGTRAEIEAACAPYGYHPLSLKLLAGWIIGDLQQPGDLAIARRLDVSGDLVQRQHHVLQQAYDSLGPWRQKLLSRIACFRSPVTYEALKALAETESPEPRASLGRAHRGRKSSEGSLDADLRDLLMRGLLHRDSTTNRFDLHPIVRRFAYGRLTASDRGNAHARLCYYFAAVPVPKDIRSVDDVIPRIELFHHAVGAGQYDEAFVVFNESIEQATFYQFGAYQLQIDLLRALFPDGEDSRPRLKSKASQGGALMALAHSYTLSGQPRSAIPLTEMSVDIARECGQTEGVALFLRDLGTLQLAIGRLRAAEVNLGNSITSLRQIKSHPHEPFVHLELGLLQVYRGLWAEAKTELAVAMTFAAKQNDVQAQGVVWSYRALRELLWLRSRLASMGATSKAINLEAAIYPAERALQFADETAHAIHPVPRDYIRAHWLIGAAQRIAGRPEEAERHLRQALERCQRINNVENEADILIDLARQRLATGATDDAERLSDEALNIAERAGYVLQRADAHLVLAQLAQRRQDPNAIRKHSTEALRLATCDGPPDYTYKAAFDEASALLRSHGTDC